MDSIVLSYAHERAYAKVVELQSRTSAKGRSKQSKSRQQQTVAPEEASDI